ncbi:MAG: DNA-3-methyladenine glycosylase family protein [Actinomycetota bacterium]
MTSLDLELRAPGGEPVDLWRTLVSHGFAELSPTVLDEEHRVLAFTVRVPGGRPRRVRISEGSDRAARVDVLGPRPGPNVVRGVLDGTAHVLRLDQDLSHFYLLAAADPDLAWAATGAGRMLRSPTVFEDVVKTVCTTNCAWSATIRMVDALVTHLGDAAIGGDGPLTNAFPTPAAMSAAPESFYREVVRAGYRGAYLVGLARAVAEGALDLEGFAAATPEELPDLELETALLALPGVGPYAAAHIMMTLGRHSRLILDSWTRPKYARLLGRKKPVTDRLIEKRFRPYGDFAGLAFWLYVTRDWVDDGPA